MTDKPITVIEMTVINRVDIGSDHWVVIGSVTLNARAERRKLLNKNTQTRVDTQSKTNQETEKAENTSFNEEAQGNDREQYTQRPNEKEAGKDQDNIEHRKLETKPLRT